MNLHLTSTIQMPEHTLRRAVIDLCEKVGKPLLKLSTKDYIDNGLGHLVEQFDHSCYPKRRLVYDHNN